MYNNSFWELKKKLMEAKKERPSSPNYVPPPEWTNDDGDTARTEYVRARANEQGQSVKSAYHALGQAIRGSGVKINHGRITDILSNPNARGSTRRLFRIADQLGKISNHKSMKQLRTALHRVANLYAKSPPHPELPGPDHDERDTRSRRDSGDPGLHWPYSPD